MNIAKVLLIVLVYPIGSVHSCFPSFFSGGRSHPPPPPYYVIHPGFQPRLPYIIECQHTHRSSHDGEHFSEPEWKNQGMMGEGKTWCEAPNYGVISRGAMGQTEAEGTKTIRVTEASA